MNQTIPTRLSAVGHWVFLAIWILSLAMSQMVRMLFSETTVFNSGLAFGVTIKNELVIPLVIIFLLLIVVWYIRTLSKNIYEISAFGMILGGGTSNLIERFMFDGQVADYWNLFNVSTINLADIFIFLGIVIMFTTILHRDK